MSGTLLLLPRHVVVHPRSDLPVLHLVLLLLHTYNSPDTLVLICIPLSWYSAPVTPVTLSCYSCSATLVLLLLFCYSSSATPVLLLLLCYSSSATPVLLFLFCYSCSATPVLLFQFRYSVLLFLFCYFVFCNVLPASRVLLILSWYLCPFLYLSFYPCPNLLSLLS